MRNMKNQEISEEEIDSVTAKIRKLSPSQLDRLLDKVGFKVFKDQNARQPGEGQYKAITTQIVENVKSDFQSARRIVVSLTFESDIELLKRELESILCSSH
jgi:hypothetical protein